jgi:hypothetical protein
MSTYAPEAMILYVYEPADDDRVVLQTLAQSFAWLTPTMIADRLRYTNLTWERIVDALARLEDAPLVERRLTYDYARIYRRLGQISPRRTTMNDDYDYDDDYNTTMAKLRDYWSYVWNEPVAIAVYLGVFAVNIIVGIIQW